MRAPTATKLVPKSSSSTTTHPLLATTTTTAVQQTATTMVPATVPAPTTTTTAIVCRNSLDARCGSFRWDPAPDNQPITVQVSVASGTHKVGQPVTFHIVVDDPDRPIEHICVGTDYGDASVPFCGRPIVERAPADQQPHGPWAPPPKQPDHLETDPTHSYRSAGSYTVHFVYRSQQSCAATGDPYYSEGTGTATITIVN